MNIPDINKNDTSIKLLLTVAVGSIGGLVFMNLHIPMPWMLGPMVAVLIGAKLCKLRLHWPTNMRNWGLIIVGYGSGLSFTKEAFFQIIQQLPWMMIMTAALLIFCALSALAVSKLAKVEYPSILTGCIPGGLTQMIMLGEEFEGMDITVITFLQVVRLMLIVFSVPLLVYSPLYSVGKAGAVVIAQTASIPINILIPKILIFAAFSIFCAMMAKMLRFPIPYLLGPILGIAVLNIWGFQGPRLSPVLLDVAQFSIGCYLGLLLKPEELQKRVMVLSIINGIVLISFSLFMGYIFVKLHGVSGVTGFLSMAPGGADQMSVIASVALADVPMVTAYQLFRMMFVNFAVPPMLRWFYRYHVRVRQAVSSVTYIDE